MKDVKNLLHKKVVKAIAHITGGGLPLNLNRVIEKHLCAEIDATSFKIPPIFGWISALANVPDNDLLRTFNCGIGMVLVVNKENLDWKFLKGAQQIGFIRKRNLNEDQVIVKNFDKGIKNICQKLKLEKDTATSTTTYESSGVDIDAGDTAVQKIKSYVKRTEIDGVLGNFFKMLLKFI